MSESLAEQAARLGIHLPIEVLEVPDTLSGTPERMFEARLYTPPGVLPRGRPRECIHSDRRPKVLRRGDKVYRTTYCRTCETEREKRRRRAVQTELDTLRALFAETSGT